jgi:hypothetical protein
MAVATNMAKAEVDDEEGEETEEVDVVEDEGDDNRDEDEDASTRGFLDGRS